MNQIQQSNTFRNTTVSNPIGLAFDSDLNKLVVTYGTSPRFFQQRGLTGNMTGGKNSIVKTNSQPISYHEGVYYVGINPPAVG